ncbi:hypothetical protein AR687_21460 [Flavobacteriaceae bacterium CRH]|nr:hypothetical protein AR687_21460 [Flavobacteriaceae bacterium CRH]
MKKTILLLIMFLILSECIGQNKKEKKINDSTISHNFNASKTLYYDIENKTAFTTYKINNIGQFTIYYFAKNKTDLDYLKNFESINKIEAKYDELNDLRYFSQKQQKEINKLLQSRLKNKKEFILLGKFIDAKYLNIEDKNEYSIIFPFKLMLYKFEKGNTWKFIKSINIKGYNDEVKYSNLNYLVKEVNGNNQKK